MIYLLIIPGAILLTFILCIPMFMASKEEEKNNHGFPFTPSKAFLEQYEEEQKVRQQIVRDHGIEALGAYLNASSTRKKK